MAIDNSMYQDPKGSQPTGSHCLPPMTCLEPSYTYHQAAPISQGRTPCASLTLCIVGELMDLPEFAIFRTKKKTHLRHDFPPKKWMAAISTGPTSHSMGFIDFYWKKCSDDEHLGCADPLASIESHCEKGGSTPRTKLEAHIYGTTNTWGGVFV